jgi:hypothetical protein
MKETLTESEIQELANILNEHAFLSMTAKTYWSSNVTFTPIVRVQAYSNLEPLAKKYGGSTYEFPIRHDGQTPKSDDEKIPPAAITASNRTKSRESTPNNPMLKTVTRQRQTAAR